MTSSSVCGPYPSPGRAQHLLSAASLEAANTQGLRSDVLGHRVWAHLAQSEASLLVELAAVAPNEAEVLLRGPLDRLEAGLRGLLQGYREEEAAALVGTLGTLAADLAQVH